MRNAIKKSGEIIIGISLVIFISNLAVSADFPNKPIRMLLPVAIGAGSDIHARKQEPYLKKYLGVPIRIENAPAASGRVATNELWSAEPDGYTLMAQSLPSPIFFELLTPDEVKYKFKEFTFIYGWSGENFILVANPEVYSTPEKFMAAAKSRSLSGGTAGFKSLGHILGLVFEEAAKLKPVNWVHYSGGSEPMAALAGKHIDFVIASTSTAMNLFKAGKCIPLIVFSNKKDFLFPDATLPKDLGLNVDLSFAYALRCVYGPPRMPPQIVDILEKAFAKTMQEPGWQDWAKKASVEYNPMNHAQLTKYVINCYEQVYKNKDKFLSK